MPAFTLQPQSITALWLVLISRPAEGRRLSWPGEMCKNGEPIKTDYILFEKMFNTTSIVV